MALLALVLLSLREAGTLRPALVGAVIALATMPFLRRVALALLGLVVAW